MSTSFDILNIADIRYAKVQTIKYIIKDNF